jgi:hypothetical protein
MSVRVRHRLPRCRFEAAKGLSKLSVLRLDAALDGFRNRGMSLESAVTQVKAAFPDERPSAAAETAPDGRMELHRAVVDHATEDGMS